GFLRTRAAERRPAGRRVVPRLRRRRRCLRGVALGAGTGRGPGCGDDGGRGWGARGRRGQGDGCCGGAFEAVHYRGSRRRFWGQGMAAHRAAATAGGVPSESSRRRRRGHDGGGGVDGGRETRLPRGERRRRH
ncbi:unnamed protein product, partial [Scytosiphon promiscuus]